MRGRSLLVAFSALGVFACGGGSSSVVSIASPSPEAERPSMDPAVSVPADLPKDFPVYPGARPTYVGEDSSLGRPGRAIDWETLDSVDMTFRFYEAHLKQGGWEIKLESQDCLGFDRRTNPSKMGVLCIHEVYIGITEIDLVLIE